MKRFVLLCSFFAMGMYASLAQRPVGAFTDHRDIGMPRLEGGTRYNETDQSYSLTGGGYNIWFNRDEFQYVYRKIDGDFMVTADFAFTGDTAGAAGHRKTGWMIRESLDPDAAAINGCQHFDALTALQWRELRGAYMQDPQGEIFFPKAGGQTIRLERKGRKVSMWVAHPGEPLQLVGTHEMPDLPDSVYVGIFICSHDSNSVAHARVWNVRIDKPVDNTYYPNPIEAKAHPPSTQVLGSRLEIMDVFTGVRRVVYESAGRFESPGWSADGKQILFDQGGTLYSVPAQGGRPEKATTPSRNLLENAGNGRYLYYTTNVTGTMQVWRLRREGLEKDQLTYDEYHNWFPHLSPDGKWIVFLSYEGDIDPGSHPRYQRVMIRMMPAAGGSPRVIAYLYGGEGSMNLPSWSPDSRQIVFVSNSEPQP